MRILDSPDATSPGRTDQNREEKCINNKWFGMCVWTFQFRIWNCYNIWKIVNIAHMAYPGSVSGWLFQINTYSLSCSSGVSWPVPIWYNKLLICPAAHGNKHSTTYVHMTLQKRNIRKRREAGLTVVGDFLDVAATCLGEVAEVPGQGPVAVHSPVRHGHGRRCAVSHSLG